MIGENGPQNNVGIEAGDTDDDRGRGNAQGVSEEAAQFIRVLFEDGDFITVRPIETWVEDNRKRSRVLYRSGVAVTAR